MTNLVPPKRFNKSLASRNTHLNYYYENATTPPLQSKLRLSELIMNIHYMTIDHPFRISLTQRERVLYLCAGMVDLQLQDHGDQHGEGG